MMDKELKAKWVAALRSGEYVQGKQKLYNPAKNTFCCLGVLHTLTGVTGAALCKLGDATDELGYAETCLDEKWHEPSLEGYELGLSLELRTRLAEMNDGQSHTDPELTVPSKSFAELADWIEANIPCTN